MKFYKGDRVVSCIDNPSLGDMLEGDLGTVVIADNNDVGVAWDKKYPRAHNLNGRGDDRHGWWVFSYEIKLAEDPDESSDICLDELFS